MLFFLSNFFRYSLKNRNDVEVRITNYGGNITNIFSPDKNGQIGDIVLGYDTFEGIFILFMK